MRLSTLPRLARIGISVTFLAGTLLTVVASAQATPALGTTTILVSSAAGSSSVVLSDGTPWTATASASFLHLAAGSASGTSSAVVAFTYDAFIGTGTRSGTLTIAGLTLTVTQAGTNYVGPGGLTTLVSSGVGNPNGVAVDGLGNVYIADTGNQAVEVWNASTQQVTTLVSSGLSNPYGVAVDGSGNVYIVDRNGSDIKEWSASTQQVTTLVPSGLNYPTGIALDGSGNVYIVDNGSNSIKEWSASTQQLTTLATAGLRYPYGVAVDSSGNIYIADTGNNAVKEWNASTQAITTLVSSGLNSPYGVAVDGSGNVYIADTNNSAIKEWNSSTQLVTTLASSGLNYPFGLAVSGSGTVYIADSGNNAIEEIPLAFAGPTSVIETFSAGSDVLLQVIPSTQSLAGIFAPSSDQSWLTIGSISGGVVNFSFTANGTISPRTAHITILGQQIPVTQAAAPPAPAFTCTNNGIPLEIGVAYTTTCTVTDGAGTQPFTWSISAGVLPTGVTAGTTATSITLTGPATFPGAASYTIQLSDATSRTATQAFSGTIAAAVAFTCTNNNVPTQINAAYTTTCTVTGGAGDAPFTWSISAGALPAGIVPGAAATSLTLTGPATVSGAVSYTIQLSDAAGFTATQTFSGTIAGFVVLANWTFANGNNLGADSSGNGYNLTPMGNGAIGFDATALGGQGAAVFNGSNYFNWGGASPLFPPLLPIGNASYTITAWINPGNIGAGAYGIVGWGAYGTSDATNAFRTDGNGGVVNYSWGDDAEDDPPSFTVMDGKWHFVAVTYDSATRNRYVYIDPATSGLSPYHSNPGNTLNVQPANFNVGETCSTCGGEYFQGEMSQLQVFNYPLTLAQVEALDNAPAIPVLGANTILVSSAAGSSSVVLSDGTAWTAASNDSFLHVTAGSASGTGSAVVAFIYDAFSGAGTRSGTLTIAGLTVTVTQVGTNYSAVTALTTVVSAGLNNPAGIAVDGSGNVYIADAGNNAVREWTASTQALTTLVSSGLNNPYGLAVDGSGNVYIADTGNNAIKEWTASTQQVTTLVSSGLNSPVAVAVDGSGNVYIVDDGNNAIKEWVAATQQITTLIPSGLLNPRGVAVDASGNLYIADSNNLAIKEWNASTQALTTLTFAGYPQGVTVDGSGNVYFATSSVGLWNASSQQVTSLVSSGLSRPIGLATDGIGNVYIADTGNNAIKEIPLVFAGPATVSETFSAGTDALLQVLPSTQSLVGVYAPASDQNWLTIGTIIGGVVNFSFSTNSTGLARTANITILGQQIPVTQQAAPALTVSTITVPNGTVNQPFGPVTMAATGGSGVAANYQWTSSTLPAGLSITLTSGTITGTPTAAGNNATVAITVTDTVSGQSTSKTFAINIAYPALTISTANPLPPGMQGTPYAGVTLVAAGGSGLAADYKWTSSTLPAGLTIGLTTGTITGTPTAAGNYPKIVITVSDAVSSQSTSKAFAIDIAYPALTISTTSQLPAGTQGTPYAAVTLAATGGSGVAANYQWTASALPPGLIVGLTTGAITGTPTAAGNYPNVVITVSDTVSSQSTPKTFTINVVYPVLSITTPGALPAGTQGTPYPSLTLAATGGSGLAANYQWTESALPPGLSIGFTTGAIAGTPTAAGNYTNVLITVSDTVSNQSTQKTFTINVLSIATTSLPPGQVGQTYSASLSAAGGTGFYVWNSGALPAGLSLDALAGSISGTPTATWGTPVQFTVTDQISRQSASVSLTLTVTALPLIITGNGNADVAVGGALAASYSASGGVPPYKWTLSGAAGFTVDSSGNIGGTGSSPGSFSASLTVTDSVNTSSSMSVSISVLGLTGSFPAGTTTSLYSGSATGVGGAPPYSYTASGIPQGLSFAGGTLSGQAKTPGTSTIGVQVADSKGVTVSGNFQVAITGPAPTLLTITTASLPDGSAGQPYSQTLGAAGGKPAYTWSQTGGQLPAGLSLSGSGAVLGTPTATGPYSIGVQVADSTGAEVVGTVSINIDPAPLTITNGAVFPGGQVGVDYPAQILTASGGTQPYTFSIAGALPAGLALDTGQIDGTPSALGSFSFTLAVSDSATPPATATLGVSTTIKPNSPDLSLSAATASFSLTVGTTAVPSPRTIVVSATVISETIDFTTSSSVPWLTAAGSSSTPGSISVGPNNAALTLSASGSPYSGTVTVTCSTPACAGHSQTIAVTLLVTAAPPQLSLGTPLLSFVALSSNPQPSSEPVSIVNAGGGSLAIQSVSAADSWITVGAFPATVAPGPGVSVSVTANSVGLKTGYYLSSLTVVSSAGSLSIPLTLLISGASVMTLGPAGTQFSMPQGGALGNAAGSFLVTVSSGSATFIATVLPGTPWLSGSGSGSASPGNPGSVSFSIDQTAVGALAAGSYYGTIEVSGTGISNSPQDFQVILSVSPATARVVPDPQPAGLIFIASSSGATLPPQTMKLFASSKSALAFQSSASVTDGSGWLSATPATGSTSAASAASVTVTASPASLAPGVYRGSVSFSFASAVRSVNVTLIVQAGVAGASSTAQTPARLGPLASASCAGAQLVPTQTGLVSNFSAPASWPTALAVTLVDTCGSPIGNGQIVTTFSNGDPPLVLSPTDSANGLYSGTWTPRNTSSQVTILANASAPGYTTSKVQIAGQVAHNAAPALSPNGTLDVFHPQTGAGFGPGNIVQIFGSGLANQTNSAVQLPLPEQINGTIVLIGGIKAPLYFVSATQINAQIPFELLAGSQYQVIVSANGALTTPQPIQLTTAVPAILQFTSGAVVAQHPDGTLVSDTSPATPGEYVVIYLSGLGATDISVPSGSASPSNPPANVLDTPVLTLNGTEVPTVFAGLAPTFVGLYQINFQIPQAFVSGNYQLLITQSGTASNQTILSVQQPAQQ